MTKKPRKPLPSIREQIDEAVAEALPEALANSTFDAGEYRSEVPKPGRPPINLTRIDVMIDAYLAKPTILSQKVFIEWMRDWYRLETRQLPPAARTLQNRIQQRAHQKSISGN
jgi:hypothetical protein